MLQREQGNAPGRRMLGAISIIISLLLILQLWLSMKMAEDSYYLFDLKKELSGLETEVAIVAQERDLLDSLPELHRKAVELGMVRSEDLKYIYLNIVSEQ